MRKAGTIEDITVEARVWIATATNGGLECTTIALHRKRPGRPNRAGCEDAVRDVEKGVDGEGAGRETLGVMLVVDAVGGTVSFGSWKDRNLNILLVFLNPRNETVTKVLNLGGCDLEAETDGDKTHELNKVVVVLVVEEAPSKDDGSDVLSPKRASVGGPRDLVSRNVGWTGTEYVG